MLKLNLMCPINSTGYGISSYNIYKELRKLTDITLFPISNASVDSEESKNMLTQDIKKQEFFDKNNPCFKIWHQFDLATRVGKGKYGALTFFEIDKLKPIEISIINNLDIVFVASNWAKNVLLDNNVTTQIAVSPLGVDPSIFDNKLNSQVEKNNDKYIFLNIGKWEIRKGHDILVEIFNKAFTKDDNVELWMMNENPFLSKEENMSWINLYNGSKLNSKIKIVPKVGSHKDVAKIIAMADCGIFPARAEGWNNETVECFALNKPIILTNYSAHTEYANKNNAYLIDINNKVPAIDDKFFDGYGQWADIGKKQIEQCVEYMRYVYKNDIRTNPEGLKTAEKFSWSNTANIIKENME